MSIISPATYRLVTYVPTFVLFIAMLYPFYILSLPPRRRMLIKYGFRPLKNCDCMKATNTIGGVAWTKEETKANYVLEDGTQWRDYDAHLPIRVSWQSMEGPSLSSPS